jgi:hypothetical protein
MSICSANKYFTRLFDVVGDKSDSDPHSARDQAAHFRSKPLPRPLPENGEGSKRGAYQEGRLFRKALQMGGRSIKIGQLAF